MWKIQEYSLFIFFAIFVAITFSEQQQQGPQCLYPYSQYGSYCYYISQSQNLVNWYQAKQICQTHYYGVLAMLDTEEKINVLTEYLLQNNYTASSTHFWISGNNQGDASEWIWDSSSVSIEYYNWANAQPDNNGGNQRCLLLSGPLNFQWDDEVCTIPKSFICQPETEY